MLIRLSGLLLFLLLLTSVHAGGSDSSFTNDLLLEYRIAELDLATPVPLDFNQHVKEFISLFTEERHEVIGKVVGLGELYFPVIEEILDRNDLPFEIKYISIVESALDPYAVSPSGAVGLWQFLLHTAKMFDLEVNSFIDERRDIYKSTEAAARYMSYLYDMFGDWHLVFAAYNSGPGAVRNAIERSGGSRNYWEIRKFLPEQSRRFVPAFIAINYLMKYYRDYNIEPVPPAYTFECIDTLHISRALSFSQISGELDIPVETLRLLNPVYRIDRIPANRKSNTLVLPVDYIKPFIHNFERVFTHGLSSNTPDNSLLAGSELVRITHSVRRGEYIHKIAMIYGTVAGRIMEWNNLDSDSIYVGQDLTIWVQPEIIERLDAGLPFSIEDHGGIGQ
jgi:membrane-bound lytic murein transglycosylase D